MARHDSSRISPTAHYTGYVWSKNGLSHPALDTSAGKYMFQALQPFMMMSRVFGGPVMEDMLMARHQCLEHLLARAIDNGSVSQVVEIASGLSPRGLRMMRRFRHKKLVYVESDLPDMAARKRERLSSIGADLSGHHVVELDALDDMGERSLSAVGARYLDPKAGTAVITEGLINYFDEATIMGLWQRVARFLKTFPSGVYLSELLIKEDLEDITGVSAFTTALTAFTRGRVRIHFEVANDAELALRSAGFSRPRSHRANDLAAAVALTPGQRYAPVRLIEARV